MAEKKTLLSKNTLIITGITVLIIFIVGLVSLIPEVNYAYYSSSSTVRAIFSAITYLGEPIVFIVIIAILYLGYNKVTAKNLALSLLTSFYLNSVFKEIIQDRRPPFNTDITEDLGVVESSYGFPSGHAQTAVAFWGQASYEFKDKYKYNDIPIIPLILSVIIFLVAISRIVIGVHDLQDIIGALLIGIGLLLAYIYLEPIVTPKFDKLNLNIKLVLVVIISLALFLLGTILWPRASTQLATQNLPPNYSDAGAFGLVGGALLGFGVGYLLEQEYIKYDPSSLSNKNRVINVVLGIVILFVVFLPFEYLLKIDSAFYRFARYAIVSFLLTYVVPLICTKINK